MALGNHVLSSLSAQDIALLRPHLTPVVLPFRQSLEEPNAPIAYAYFPEDGIVSIVAHAGKRFEVEVGIIGRDGMTAQPVVLGTDRSANSTFVQVAGHGQRIATAALRKAMQSSPSLHRSFMAVVQAFIMQASHTALANGRAKLDERTARWLVMAHDRLPTDELPLTHEFLSIMLGVRRSGVTVALKELEVAGLIKTSRGSILVKDRKGLEALAGGIYGVPETEQERLTGWKSQKKNK
jgi:CRP-like cAMP-binding protein